MSNIIYFIFSKIYLIAIILIVIILIFYFYKKFKLNMKKFKTKTIKIEHLTFYLLIIILITSVFYLIFLYSIFIDHDQFIKKNSNYINYNNFSQIKIENPFLYFNKNENNTLKSIQSINFIIITNKKTSKIFNKNWTKNKITLIDNISTIEYLKLIINKTPPTSILYYNNYPQDLAYQYNSKSNSQREHLRLYKTGHLNSKTVYFGSTSKDIESEILIYKNFLTPFHEISPNIDQSILFLKKYFISNNITQNCSFYFINNKIINYSNNNFNTQGKIMVCYI